MNTNYSLSIAVIWGGPSAEAEVSLSSARGVMQALKNNYENVHLVELDEQIDRSLRDLNPDVVFPAVHGKWGEDGLLQGLLTICGFPYVGSETQAQVLAMNKVLAKQIFALNDLPVAQSTVVNKQQNLTLAAKRSLELLGDSVVVKPVAAGSSVGVSFADNVKALEEGLEKALHYDDQALVEERIIGAEITVAILERDHVEALPVIEIRTPENTWYDYEHRYTAGLSEHIMPAPLPKDQYNRVQEISVLAHQALGCRDFSRADFVVPKQGEPILLEVNTIPGMTSTSLFPDAAQAAGLPFPELVHLLVQQAFSRAQRLTALSDV